MAVLLLSTASPVVETVPQTLAATTASITLRLRRPTTGNPLAWDSATVIRLSIIETVDGVDYVHSSQATGGTRSRRGSPVAEVTKTITPQVSARTDGGRTEFVQGGKTFLQLTRRGEMAKSAYTVRARFELLQGTAATLDLLGMEVTEAPAPTIEYHHSVAFDSAIDAQDTSTDGVITLTIDPTGTAQLAAFAGSGNSSGGGGRLGSTTYNGVAMDEKWDEVFNTLYGHAGYVLAGIPSTSVNVVNTLAAAPDEHAFGVMVFTGVDQTTPAGTAAFSNGSGTTMSNTVTDALTAGMVVDNLYCESSPTMGADQTTQNTENIGGFTFFRQSTQAASVVPATMSWTQASDTWGHGAIALRPHITAALTGTVTASITEADVVAGGKDIILTLTDGTFVDNLADIAYVGGQVNSFAGTTSNTDVNFALTNGLAATPAAGDLVVVAFATGSTADRTLSITNTAGTAYTTIGSELYSNDTFDTNLLVAYRFMPGTPETAVRFAGGTGNAADAGTYCFKVYRNVDTGTPLDVAATTATGIDTRLANPPSITPSTAGAWIQIVGACAGGTTAAFTDPGDLSDWRTDPQVDTNDSTIGSGHYTAWTSGAYDHAAFAGGGTDTTNDSWAALAFALRPATDSAFDNQRDEIRDGVDSDQGEGNGWDALKSTTMPVGNVVRTSATVVTITLAAAGSYDITAQETITATLPTGAIVGGSTVVASPTFTIDTSGGGGSVVKDFLAGFIPHAR